MDACLYNRKTHVRNRYVVSEANTWDGAGGTAGGGNKKISLSLQM